MVRKFGFFGVPNRRRLGCSGPRSDAYRYIYFLSEAENAVVLYKNSISKYLTPEIGLHLVHMTIVLTWKSNVYGRIKKSNYLLWTWSGPLFSRCRKIKLMGKCKRKMLTLCMAEDTSLSNMWPRACARIKTNKAFKTIHCISCLTELQSLKNSRIVRAKWKNTQIVQ